MNSAVDEIPSTEIDMGEIMWGRGNRPTRVLAPRPIVTGIHHCAAKILNTCTSSTWLLVAIYGATMTTRRHSRIVLYKLQVRTDKILCTGRSEIVSNVLRKTVSIQSPGLNLLAPIPVPWLCLNCLNLRLNLCLNIRIFVWMATATVTKTPATTPATAMLTSIFGWQ